jgi:hypothetical protein
MEEREHFCGKNIKTKAYMSLCNIEMDMKYGGVTAMYGGLHLQ